MSDPTFGRLEKLEPRDYWPNEASNFTPWLAEPPNIRLLGEAIGVELEVETVEAAVGPFAADIVCRSLGDEHRVVIENQLERTNHDHLGKLLTYAGGLDDVRTTVWIAPEIREEHRAALDWLNSVTGEEVNFFGVELQVWKIGGSLPAPKFEVAVKPNDWVETVRGTTKSGDELSAAKKLQLDYWTAFRDYLQERESEVRLRKPAPQHWANVSIGRSGARLSAIAGTWDEDQKAYVNGLNRVDLVLDGDDSKELFARLQAEREAIEAELGEPLTWHNPERARMCRVYTRRLVDLRNRDDWSNQFDWLEEQLQRFDQSFRDRVKRE